MRIVLNNNKDLFILLIAFTVISSSKSNIVKMLSKRNALHEKFMNNLSLKDSWLARTIYQQTEVFRFGNPLVDDWEGKVNAWPLDEGLIDYVDNTNYYPSENDFSNFNVIANKKLKVEGELIDASVIT